MKSIAVFNNKSGVGKTTLVYHLGCALAELGHKTLLVDLDPQSNLTLFGLDPEALHALWKTEEAFIDDFAEARSQHAAEFEKIASDTRSIHFLLKPTEDGTEPPDVLAQPLNLQEGLDLIPSRLSIHTYEDKIASRWSDVYMGDPLAIRTVTQIRNLCDAYAKEQGYDYVVIDTSPSLGPLNKTIISTVDGFLIPCMPDMFSLYGIQNIGKSLKRWKQDFDTLFKVLSTPKLRLFSQKPVSFLGFTIFNARKHNGSSPLNLAKIDETYAEQISTTIKTYIDREHRKHLTDQQIETPIGGDMAIMHAYSTLPNMAQKYRNPMWKVPACEELESDDKGTIAGNRKSYEGTQTGFQVFAKDLITRLSKLEEIDG